jgi:hypothetical protein
VHEENILEDETERSKRMKVDGVELPDEYDARIDVEDAGSHSVVKTGDL